MDYRLIVDSYSQGDVDSLVSARRLISDSYSQSQTDALLSGKQDDLLIYGPLNGQVLSFSDVDGFVFVNNGGWDLANYYTKNESDALYRTIADSYSQANVDMILSNYRTIALSYSSNETDILLSDKQNNLTGLATFGPNKILAANAAGDALVWIN